MQMPDARNYAPAAGAGGYPSYGSEGGYGAAAALGGAAAGAGAGAAAYGASRRGFEPNDYSSYSQSSTDPTSPNPGGSPPPPMTAAQAKQREAQNERARNRLSANNSQQWGSSYANVNPAPGSSGGYNEYEGNTPPADNRRESQALSDGGRSTVYQHTDMGSVPDEAEEAEPPAEVPPG